MKLSLILITFIFSGILNTKDTDKVAVSWVNHLAGDFSFAKRKTIDCEASCYEWAGTDETVTRRIDNDTVRFHTLMNEATHCSLHLLLANDSCTPTIELNSIVPKGNRIYPFKSGWIKLDKTLWQQNILKAEFDFEFVNDENEKRIFWKGRIYTRIK